MKRLILTDATGKIVATGPHPDDLQHAGQSSKGRFGFMPLAGQTVHEVELPAHVTTIEHLQQLHTSHRVAVEDGVAKLVERTATD
jgi:hypothetical protein